MEVKVYVEGIQRIVCGVTDKTTCEEIVIALAQATGRTGRYTLREKVKEYERNVTPGERLLESLTKYGQQAREVQLTLQHLGPSLGEGTNEPLAPLRRGEAEGRTRRGVGGAGLHRQSLPLLSCLRLHPEPLPEELKKPKRKSLTLMEEAWGWLENLGRVGRQQLGRDKGKCKDDDKGDGRSDSAGARPGKIAPASGALQGRDKKEKHKSREDQTRISRLGKCGKETLEYEVVGRNVGAEQSDGSFEAVRGEEAELRRIIIQQQACLRELELKIDSSDEQSRLLELQQAERWSAERIPLLSEEEEEQLEFWLNELKAEGDYEKDLQTEFLQLKEKVAECKNKLEEYKAKLLHADGTSSSVQTVQSEEVESTSGSAMEEKTVADSPGGGSKERAAITTVDSKLPCVLESANQIESQPSGPSELREWWSRWAQAQKPTQGSTPKTVHRSELTIHLGSTRV
ncbi:ras association domain-containing protein 8 [Electrophorus electricus]|uniref:ras association domain-containing protein 8 n=1 Tax=Electrophorus electricus TaxID=8005 RepID=UPI0015CF8C28|nr:ras association domain-containing protein 8 [Electrophorus electricus]